VASNTNILYLQNSLNKPSHGDVTVSNTTGMKATNQFHVM